MYLLIVSMFVIFVMDPVEDFADRINICLTLILAAVAFLYVVGEQLPKVPYLTLLDKLLLISFFFIFLGGVETLVAFLVKTHVDGDGDNGKMDGGNSMFVIFVMDPVEDFADRINICLTLILAAVAFLYVVGEQLPKVPYLTLLDKLLLISFFFIFLGGVETLVAFLVKTHVDGDGDNGKMDGGNLHVKIDR